MKKLTHFSLFSGIGGIDLAAESAGQEQHPWEPPRIATGMKNRADRLKCLGNAVVPGQVYPILRAIAIVERSSENDD